MSPPDEAVIARIADLLWRAAVQGASCPPPSTVKEDLTVAQAYAVSRCVLGRHLAAGRTVAGLKAGLTSEVAREALGADEPDVGAVLAHTLVPDGGAVEVAVLRAPAVEVELAVVLGDDLGPGPWTAEDLASSRSLVAPAIEIVDSRTGWRHGLVDTIADNAAAAGAVIGATRPIAGVDTVGLVGVVRRGGKAVARGQATAVLGDPLRAAAWLLTAASEHLAMAPEPGHVLLTGAFAPMVPVVAGDHITVELGPLGSTSVRFT